VGNLGRSFFCPGFLGGAEFLSGGVGFGAESIEIVGAENEVDAVVTWGETGVGAVKFLAEMRAVDRDEFVGHRLRDSLTEGEFRLVDDLEIFVQGELEEWCWRFVGGGFGHRRKSGKTCSL